ASFRRTFTAGPLALVHRSARLPEDWLGLDHVALDPSELPSRGREGTLCVAYSDDELLRRITLIDTPDLDGDQPHPHLQADRVFRWADAVLFLVTPEKYQMTELLPYYRLARRYALPGLFVMNKVEQQEVVEDYVRQLQSTDAVREAAGSVFAVARND